MQAHQIYMNNQQQQNNAHLAWVQTQNGHTAQDRGRAEEQPKEELQLDSTLQRGYDGDSSAYEPPAKKVRTDFRTGPGLHRHWVGVIRSSLRSSRLIPSLVAVPNQPDHQ
jgi:hypothetical protein